LGDFDPNVVGFGVAIYNANGPVHIAFVPPGSFTERGSRGGLATRYRFKDRSARSLGEASSASGLYRVNLRFRTVCGEPSITAKIEMYADMSDATLADMTTQFYNVNDLGALTATWARRPRDTGKTLKGWTLRLSHLVGAINPGACN
jgi:hypothetical protein